MPLTLDQSDNSKIPSAPEYMKGWKPEFNHGCCPDCNCELPPVCTTVTQLFTRASQDPSMVIVTENDYYCKCQGKGVVAGCDNPPPDNLDCSSNITS